MKPTPYVYWPPMAFGKPRPLVGKLADLAKHSRGMPNAVSGTFSTYQMHFSIRAGYYRRHKPIPKTGRAVA